MVTATAERRTEVSRRSHYRPHLDGLRAVAVYLVVAYHAGIGAMSGGFIGVDVFFVLSGYLVTQLLLRDMERFGGVRKRRFYARRYRRLLPAAFVTLVVTAIAFVIVATAAEVADSVGAFRASFLYYANWYFIHQSADYFAADINRSPVIQFWSLAIEEQFYLVWPLLLTAMFAVSRLFRRHQTAIVRGAVVLLGFSSAVAALHVSGYDINRAYYGTDTRGYELLAGALLALTPRFFEFGARAARAVSVTGTVALVAIVVLATPAFSFDPIHRGIATTLATCALLVAIESSRGAAATQALSPSHLTYLGRLSYGTYLWHWPVIVVITHEVTLGSTAEFVVAAVVATALAAASYHLLERRVRYSGWLDTYPRRVIVAGLALSLVGGLVVAPRILDATHAASLEVAGVNGVDVHTLDWRAAQKDIPPLPDCSLAHLESCTIVRGSGPHILLLGDSNARMYIPTFEKIARDNGLTLSVAAAPLCPWQRGLFYFFGGDDCRTIRNDWYGGLIDALAPQVIVVVDRPMDDPASATVVVTSRGTFDPGSPSFESTLIDQSAQSLEYLRANGRKVVIVEPIPITSKDHNPLNCLSSAASVDECIYNANAQPTALENFYRSQVAPGAVWSLDLDRLVCRRLPTCDPVIDGLIVKRDENHLTATYAAALAEPVASLLRQDGVLG